MLTSSTVETECLSRYINLRSSILLTDSQSLALCPDFSQFYEHWLYCLAHGFHTLVPLF